MLFHIFEHVFCGYVRNLPFENYHSRIRRESGWCSTTRRQQGGRPSRRSSCSPCSRTPPSSPSPGRTGCNVAEPDEISLETKQDAKKGQQSPKGEPCDKEDERD